MHELHKVNYCLNFAESLQQRPALQSSRMGREEKKREVDGAAVEGGDGKPVSKFFFGGEDHIFNFLIFNFLTVFPPFI